MVKLFVHPKNEKGTIVRALFQSTFEFVKAASHRRLTYLIAVRCFSGIRYLISLPPYIFTVTVFTSV